MNSFLPCENIRIALCCGSICYGLTVINFPLQHSIMLLLCCPVALAVVVAVNSRRIFKKRSDNFMCSLFFAFGSFLCVSFFLHFFVQPFESIFIELSLQHYYRTRWSNAIISSTNAYRRSPFYLLTLFDSSSCDFSLQFCIVLRDKLQTKQAHFNRMQSQWQQKSRIFSAGSAF